MSQNLLAKTSKAKSPLAILFITVFIDLVGFGMIIPLSPFLAQNFGATPFQVGLLMAIYSAFQFVFSPFWGQISDRCGRRPILLMSLLGSSLAHLFFGLGQSLFILFVARAFAGFFGANITTAIAYIADTTGEKNRSKGMGLIGAAFGLGFVLGPAFGGLLASVSSQAVAFTASAICFINFVSAYFLLPESLHAKKDKASLHWKKSLFSLRLSSLFYSLKKPVIGPLLVVSFMMSMGLSTIEASLFLYVKDFLNWSLQTASFGFAYVGIAMALNQGLLVRKILPLLGEAKILLIGAFLFSIAQFLAGLSPTLWGLAVAMTLLALGSGFVNPSIHGSVSLLSSSQEQGEVLGVVQSLSALARIFGPLLGGWSYSAVSPHAPFYISGLLGLAGFSIILLIFYRIPSAALKSTSSTIPDWQPYHIGLFQLQNIIRSGTKFSIFEISSSSELSSTSNLWPQDLKFLKDKIFSIEKTKLVEHLNTLVIENKILKTDPVILICQKGSDSEKLYSTLQNEQFINVFVARGGALGLIDDLNDLKQNGEFHG